MSNVFSIDKNHLNGKVNPIYDLFLLYSHSKAITDANNEAGFVWTDSTLLSS